MVGNQLQYLPIVVVLALITGLGVIILLLNRFIGPRIINDIKSSTFECGSDPIGSARQRFNVKFYLVAIFFIVFDIEAVFMYPWAGLFREMIIEPGVGWTTFAEMFIFVGILASGLVYVWRRGALEWD